MAEFLFLLVFYGVPFAALFLLRRPHWLAAGAALATLVLAGLFVAMQNSSGDAGMGAFFVFAAALVGFLSGLGARLVLFAMGRARDERAPPEKLVGLLFFLGVPLVIFIVSNVQQEQSRRRYAPPSDECRQKLHKVRVADATLHLPLLGGITLSESRTYGRLTSLYPQEKAREFCERAERETARYTMVRIDLPMLATSPVPRSRPPCDRPRPKTWWPVLCRYERAERYGLYSIALFDPRRYDAATMLSFVPDGGRGAPGPQWTRGADGFFRAQSEDSMFLRGSMGPGVRSRWSASCVHQTASGSGELQWRCRAGYYLPGGVGLVYDFASGLDTRAAEARKYDDQAYAVAAGFLQDEGTVPARR